MKVLIMGAKGMLGTALCERFKNDELEAWDRDELDITDGPKVMEKIGALKPEFIINAAAYTNVDGAESNRELAFSINERGVHNLARAAKQVNATLIHYSTDYVFSGEKSDGYAESDEPGPAINVYGESKLAGERAIQEVNPKYFILRTAWLYGHNGKNFVDTMLDLATKNPEIKVVNDQFGSPTYTKDLTDVTFQIINGGYESGVYHATNSGSTTWYDFACVIFKAAGVTAKVIPVTSEQFPRPAKRPKYSILRSTKGPELRSWQEALDEYIKTR